MNEPLAPAIVFPFHDTDGVMFSHLRRSTPILKEHFARAFVGISPATFRERREQVESLSRDTFFDLSYNDEGSLIGEHFLGAYRRAAEACLPEQVVHLCNLDRLAFALESGWKERFLDDVLSLAPDDLPVVFQRSEEAWRTHPVNYYAAESVLTRAGEVLFGKSFDFVWNHLVIQAGNLREILPRITRRDLCFLAEIILLLRNDIRTKEVGWLAWEDPFILGRDAVQLKAEREADENEIKKRLAYTVPVLEMILREGLSEGRDVREG